MNLEKEPVSMEKNAVSDASCSSQELASYGDMLVKNCDDALEWVERNTDVVRNEREGILKDLRKARRTLRGCARAARQKMCAGVFGPSQAGKSYLISALARGSNNELLARFGDETVDFVQDLNPEGGKESTGLVTRFTLTAPGGMPAGYPVHVRLLSELDLVKIIANTYFADFEHNTPAANDMAQKIEGIKSRSNAPGSRVDLDDLEDLREYLLKEFGGKSRVQDLERNFWNEAVALGPKLDLEGRIQLYSLIWDNVEEFTALLRKLLTALEKLDFAEDLYCSLDALIPKDKSIIDVATLASLEKDNKADLRVCTPGGLKTTLERPVVTALTAELTIVMKEKPAEYFTHTDLLDFPGYRSRRELPDVAQALKGDGMLVELFLRGKVAYLFQKYCAMRELNSMLLCIGPGPQEVQGLPGAINSWICSTHGATPEAREGKLVSLLFVLTKFDMEFENKAGSQSFVTRWDNRLQSSLLNFFGSGDNSWTTHWTRNQGFNNLFLLRNPNVKFEAVFSYSAQEETGVRPERQDFVTQLQKGFLDSQLVAAHFKNPARAWDEAMRTNDGGISWIRESLNPLCNPEIKKQQLLNNMLECRNGVVMRLKPYYHSDDREELRQQKRRLSENLFVALENLEDESHSRLGQLIHGFTVSDADIYDMYPEAARRFRERSLEDEAREKNTSAPSDTPESARTGTQNANPFARRRNKTQQQPTAPQNGEIVDEESFFASYIANKWVERLHAMADDDTLQKYFMLHPQLFTDLVNELRAGLERLAYREAMVGEFRKISAYANTLKENIVRKQSAIAAQMLNDYINYLGYNPNKPASERTVTLEGLEPFVVFAPHGKPEGLPRLEETRTPYEEDWFYEWRGSLVSLIMENVNFDGKQTVNVAENSLLGDILKKLNATGICQ